MSETSYLAKNLEFLMDKQGLNANSLQDKSGITQSTTSRILNGSTKNPRDNVLQQYVDFFGVSVSDLRYKDLTKQSEMTAKSEVDAMIARMPNATTYDEIEPWRESIAVELYDLKFCCGHGAGSTEFEPLKKTLPFDGSFFHRRKIKPHNFKLIYAKGDSMAPYINEGDVVGVDIGDTEIKEGEVYALWLDGDWMIKRFFKEGGGVLRLASDNATYRDKIINERNGESLIIIGRVMYRSG